MRSVFLLVLLLLLSVAVSPAQAEGFAGAVGMRAGLGTDITGGVAYGVQLDYTLDKREDAFEFGLALFGGEFTEDSDSGYHSYHEETTVVVFGAIANYLFRYSSPSGGPYFMLGGGVGAFSVEWTESSDTDSSLGPPLPGGGSSQSEEGTAGGVLLNFGIGTRFNDKWDLRAAIPTFFISGGDERGSAVVPTLTVTAGVKF
jgi:hypothetical protein